MMKPESYEEYKVKVDLIKKNKYISNCYFLPNRIKQLIGEGKIFIEEVDNNLFILEKESTFYRLYYYICNIEIHSPLQLDMPTVIEFPFKDSLSDKQKAEIELIQKLGFVLERESGRMSEKSESINISEIVYPDKSIRIDFSDSGDYEKIRDMLIGAFNPMFSFIPEERELKDLINTKQILAVYLNEQIAGILNMDVCGKNAWLRHLVIDERYRGRGLAYLLLNRYHKELKLTVNEFMHWVDLNNKAAVSVYKKMGYEFDGRKANEYVCYPMR